MIYLYYVQPGETRGTGGGHLRLCLVVLRLKPDKNLRRCRDPFRVFLKKRPWAVAGKCVVEKILVLFWHGPNKQHHHPSLNNITSNVLRVCWRRDHRAFKTLQSPAHSLFHLNNRWRAGGGREREREREKGREWESEEGEETCKEWKGGRDGEVARGEEKEGKSRQVERKLFFLCVC